MQSSQHSFFDELDPFCPTTHIPTSSLSSYSIPTHSSTINTDLMSVFTPMKRSNIHSPATSSSTSTVLQNMQEQIKSLQDRFRQHMNSLSPSVPSRSTHHTSIEPSSYLVHTNSIKALMDRIRQIETENNQLRWELMIRSSMNNNNLTNPSYQHLPSLSSPHYSQYSSPFQPLIQPSPLLSPTATSHVMLQTEPIFKSSMVDNASMVSSIETSDTMVQTESISELSLVDNTPMISPPATPIITSSTLPIYTSLSVLSKSLQTFVLSPSTTFTMTLPNDLSTFNELPNEQPIQFLNDLELQTTAIVDNNDSSILQTVQQALSDSSLIWVGRVQKSSVPIHTWQDFKVHFHQQDTYHNKRKRKKEKR